MKTVKLIVFLIILASFVAGMLTSCIGTAYTCPTYAAKPKPANNQL